jgi:hypothetical protein
MAMHTAGLLGGVDNTFARVASIDMTSPDLLTHPERLLVLKHSIAWEHYLLNYTNFTPLLAAVKHTITDIDHIEFLFPLQSRWPWLSAQVTTHNAVHIHVNDIDKVWREWRELHDTLYQVVCN